MATATSRTNRVFVPALNQWVQFYNRTEMRTGHPARSARFKSDADMLSAESVALPIDWTKGGSLKFPMDMNDQLGDCMVAAAEHCDGTWTGNVGTESVFDDATTKKWYLALAGGDNGLDERTLSVDGKTGINNIKEATYLDTLDIDPTNTTLVNNMLQDYGCIFFMLSVPDAWINNFKPGGTWDGGPGIRPNPMNGHGVMWNGAQVNGNYVLQTWGAHVFITPAGIKACDPSAFVPVSKRWFNDQGVAPNGQTYDALAAKWHDTYNGKPLPPWTPGPTPTPTPTPIRQQIDAVFAALEQQFASKPRILAALKMVQKLVDNYLDTHSQGQTMIDPSIIQFIDAIFSTAAFLDPGYALEIRQIQNIVDAMLAMM